MPVSSCGQGRRLNADPDPLIVSLGFDPASFERLNGLRRDHFPPALNRIPAHLTLFHHLPGERVEAVADALAELAAGAVSFDVEVVGLRKLGRGVALAMQSSELVSIRAAVAARFADALTAQDRQGFRPHVTIQNKVDPAVASALHDRLAEGFEPWTATAQSLLLWRYRGGPWEAEGRFDFTCGPKTSG